MPPAGPLCFVSALVVGTASPVSAWQTWGGTVVRSTRRLAPARGDCSSTRGPASVVMRSGGADWRAFAASLLCSAAVIASPVDVGSYVRQPVAEGGARLEWSWHPPPAHALTEEQELVYEAWRVVNHAFVDKSFNGLDWKEVRLKALQTQYKSMAEARKAAKDMLKTLGDPYTRFLTPPEYESIVGMARGDVAGIGVELGPGDPESSTAARASGNPRLPVINAVLKGSPADEAGIKPEDRVVAVDGERAEGRGLDDVASLMRGHSGETVRVDVEREGRGFLAFKLRRAEIKLVPVDWRVEDVGGTVGGRQSSLALGASTASDASSLSAASSASSASSGGKGWKTLRVGVVTIRSFNKATAEDVRVAMGSVEEKGAEALVVDLRHNPGGYFPGGIDTARLFLPEDVTIVSVVDRNGVADSFQTIVAGRYSGRRWPILLVVDSQTASAAEIFTAALKENGRAKAAGQQTFGKARVQTLNELFDGSGVAVTVSLYKTPQGADINGKGIAVDYPSPCAWPSDDALACAPLELLSAAVE